MALLVLIKCLCPYTSAVRPDGIRETERQRHRGKQFHVQYKLLIKQTVETSAQICKPLKSVFLYSSGDNNIKQGRVVETWFRVFHEGVNGIMFLLRMAGRGAEVLRLRM